MAAFGHTAIFRGDGRLLDPVLQTLDGFVVAFLDLSTNAVHFVRGDGWCRGGVRPVRQSECCGTGYCVMQKQSPAGLSFVLGRVNALLGPTARGLAAIVVQSFEVRFVSHDCLQLSRVFRAILRSSRSQINRVPYSFVRRLLAARAVRLLRTLAELRETACPCP